MLEFTRTSDFWDDSLSIARLRKHDKLGYVELQAELGSCLPDGESTCSPSCSETGASASRILRRSRRRSVRGGRGHHAGAGSSTQAPGIRGLGQFELSGRQMELRTAWQRAERNQRGASRVGSPGTEMSPTALERANQRRASRVGSLDKEMELVMLASSSCRRLRGASR
eukprot:2626727-Rhodomonas_salina.1